jgi:hypothetical protein
VSLLKGKTGLVPDPVCRAQLGVDPTRWSRWERQLPNFPAAVVVLGRKYRRYDEWAAFRDALLTAGDGSSPHRPRHRAEAEAGVPP